MESSWVDFKLQIKVDNDKDSFDFSPWLSPPAMQFIFNKELSTLQNVLQMRGFILEFDGKQIDVLHVSGKTRLSLQCVGSSLCNIMSGFVTRYVARPILILTKFGKFDFKKMALNKVMVTWDEGKACYWLSGAEEDVEEAYSIVQRQHPALWDVPKGVSFEFGKKLADIRITITFDNMVHRCLLIIETPPFISRAKLQFVSAGHSIDKIVKAAKNKLLEDQTSSNVDVHQLGAIVVETLNMLVHITSTIDCKAIKVIRHEDITKETLPASYGNLSCLWEKDVSAVWITGLRSDVASSFEAIQLLIENGTKLPVYKPKSHKQEVIEEGTAQRSKGMGVGRTESNLHAEDAEQTEVETSEMKTAEGIIIKVYAGDITHLPVECIVNAANEHLAHAGGVARAIAQAAGAEFERESKAYVKNHGPLSVGACCVTSAGKMPYKYVIHTVGPTWEDYTDKQKTYCFSDLQEAVEVTFRRADKLKLRSLAIPAISSGIFGVPKEKCAEQYYKAIVSFSRQFPDAILREIHFVSIDQQMITLIKSTLEKKFDSKMDPTKATPLPDSSRPSLNDGIGKSRNRSPPTDEKDGSSMIFDVTDTTSLSLKVGNIARCEGSAIVCPQDKQCKSRGQIAGAISERLRNMEQEMAKVETRESNSFGKVILKKREITVPWEYIVHVVCPRKDKAVPLHQFEQELKQTIRNVFDEAEKHKLKKLVCPLLGASHLSVKDINETCAKCLVDVVKDLEKGNCPLKDVSVVVASLPIFNTLRGALADAGFRARGTSTSGCSIHSGDARPRSKPPEMCSVCHYPRTGTTSVKHLTSPDVKGEYCNICLEKLQNPKTLSKCGHVFCTRCIDRHFLYHPKCPTCGKTYEYFKGDQPFGTMDIARDPTKLPGHEQSDGTIVITYTFDKGYQLSSHPSPGNKYASTTRKAYIPNTPKGQLVTRLLNVAFSRRLLFTVSSSATKSTEGNIVWNGVLHKINREGGPERYGYPDSAYLDRVLDELYAKGVTKESSKFPKEYLEFSRFQN